MVSEIKQRLREYRTAGMSCRAGRSVSAQNDPLAIPDGPPAQASKTQTIDIEGYAELDLGPERITTTSPVISNMTVHVGAWVTSDAFVFGERDKDGKFRLSLPFPGGAPGGSVLKLQVYVTLVDPESQLSKPFPLGGSFACLRALSTQAPVSVVVNDPYSEQTVCRMTLKAARPFDASGLSASAVVGIDEFNKTLVAMSLEIKRTIEAASVRVPAVAKPFVDGLSFMPNGGSGELGIPALRTHYAAMSSIIEGVDRPLPHALLAYFLQLALAHSGLTIDEAARLPDREFSRFVGDVVMGITKDADGCPYQRDLTLAMGLTFDNECHFTFGLQPVTSEDIGLPYAQPNFIGRDMTPQTRPDLQRVLSVPAAGPKETRRAKLQQLASLLHSEARAALCRAGVIDDCETSATAIMLAVSTIKKMDMSSEAFRLGAQGYTALQGWTPQCYQAAAGVFTRIQNMLRSEKLKISLAVGLAGGASANSQTTEDEGPGQDVPNIDDREGLGGHCFAVMRYQDPGDATGSSLYVRILEGTSCIKVHHEAPSCIRYSVRMTVNGQETVTEPPMSRFLSLLSTSVLKETQVVNRVIGTSASEPAGIQGALDVPGFVRPTIVMRCLHSLDLSSRAGSELAFYKWCVFTGMTGESTDVGTLPLDGIEYKGLSNQLGGGCRPAQLASNSLQGVASSISPEVLGRGIAILNEVWPPLADAETFRKLLNLWEPLAPLTQVNTELGASRRKGVSYVTVACMETPASHALVDAVYETKKLLVDETNEINSSRPDSDGIFLTVMKIGTGVQIMINVPEGPSAGVSEARGPSRALTLMKSLKEAKANIGWRT
jgi:hypothetical protein